MATDLIDKTKKYLLFFDLDKTLTVGEEPIDGEVVKAINLARQKGHLVFVNTGRAYASVGKNITSPIRWDGIISSCGATLTLNGKMIWTKRIPVNVVNEIAKICFEKNQNCIFEGEEALVKINLDNNLGLYAEYLVDNLENFKELSDKIHFNKLTFYGKTPLWFKEKYLDIFDIIEHHQYEETAFKGYSKGWGINKLKEFMDFDENATISFGDSNNDLEMLKSTKVSVAMGQASEIVKNSATFVTDTFAENGVAKFINKYLL